jgi:pimeloyl-ACP methyl ester carboxylesterase
MRTAEAMVSTNGIDIAFDTFGNPGSPSMLLIMGLSSQMILWEDEFCEKFAARGFRVIRFDNRDVGRSTRLDTLGMPNFREIMKGGPATIPYTLSDMAEDAFGLLDALDIDAAHIVGASMGGMIAQVMAKSQPARVSTMTLIMSSSGNPLLPPPSPEALLYLYKPMPVQRDQYIDHFIKMWQVLNGDSLPLEDEHLKGLAERTFERGVSSVASARQLAAVFASGSRQEMLASISTPTLVIHGENDPLLQLECGKDLARCIPGSRLRVVPGMGHFLSPAVWDEIIDAVSGHAG